MRFFTLVFTLVLFSFSTAVTAQNINTLAGTGTAGYSGDSGPATAAKINTPCGVVGDPAGNVYFCDYNNNRIRKVDASGVITTFAGTGTHGYSGDGGPATAAKIGNSKGIAMDAAGNVYFSDDYCVVRKVSTSGTISTVAGISGTPGYNSDGIQATAAKLNYNWGVAIDNSGNLLIADQLNNRIRKVTLSTGIITTIAGIGTVGWGGDGGPATAAGLQGPSGVAVSISGNIYIADRGNNRVRKINTAGNISTITYPTATGTYGYTGDGGPSTAAKVYYPTGVATDSAGNVYICDENNNVIRKINTFGIISTIAGNGYHAGTGSGAFSGDGGLATAAELNQPGSVSVVPSTGSIYIADRDNNRIRIIGTLHKPYFTNGHTQSMIACENATYVSLDTALAIDDIDIGQTEIWTLVSPAMHGALVVGYTGTSTGSTVIPTGLTYSPFSSYFGSDSFSVKVFDGTAYDTTRVFVNVLPTVPYSIIGKDSICPGDTATLTYIVTGGTWGSIHTTVAAVSSAGLVTGLTPGTDSITYTYTNPCGTYTIYFPLTVRPYAFCHTGIQVAIEEGRNEIGAYPNPSSGSFQLNIPGATQEEVHITITNMVGEKVTELNTVTNKVTETGHQYPSGIYFISATTRQRKYITKMMVIE